MQPGALARPQAVNTIPPGAPAVRSDQRRRKAQRWTQLDIATPSTFATVIRAGQTPTHRGRAPSQPGSTRPRATRSRSPIPLPCSGARARSQASKCRGSSRGRHEPADPHGAGKEQLRGPNSCTHRRHPLTLSNLPGHPHKNNAPGWAEGQEGVTSRHPHRKRQGPDGLIPSVAPEGPTGSAG